VPGAVSPKTSRNALDRVRGEDHRVRVLGHEPLLAFDVPVDLSVNARQVEPAAELLAALFEQA
jgi:hypothetical protein